MTYEYVADTEVYKGYTIKIVPDNDASSPRENDNFAKMVCFHNRYNLGDEQPRETPDEYLRSLASEFDPDLGDTIEYWENGRGWDMLYAQQKDGKIKSASDASDEVIEKAIGKALDKYVVLLPLALLDHSGLHMWCGSGPHWSDSAGWDSGQVGFIYATREMILKEYGGKVLTKAKRERAQKIMRCEVEEYDQYLTGDVYGYEISKGEEDDDDYDDTTLDSCWGFYGMKYCMEEAKSSVDYMAKQPQFEI